MSEINLPFVEEDKYKNFIQNSINEIEKKFDVKLEIKDNKIKFKGSPADVKSAEDFFNSMFIMIEKGNSISEKTFKNLLKHKSNSEKEKIEKLAKNHVLSIYGKKRIKPKTENQALYIKAIRENTVVFSIGPAGTGKTFLAMAYALSSLSKKEFSRIILTRPVVEAGESLGYLPGDMIQKVNPYLRPLYDALFELTDPMKAKSLLEDDIIEIAPLAYMRGRTLNDAFIILDEAQNTTYSQMKMFLTRIGFNSKAVITGDITQIDLPKKKSSGLVKAQKILENIDGIKFVYFNEKDVVRHPLVKKIIKAFENYEKEE